MYIVRYVRSLLLTSQIIHHLYTLFTVAFLLPSDAPKIWEEGGSHAPLFLIYSGHVPGLLMCLIILELNRAALWLFTAMM